MSINVRTDLASEARRIAQGDAGEMTALHGVEAHEETLHGFGVTAVEILDDNGAQKLNKPIGKYFSLELPSFMDRGGENFAGAAEAISEVTRHLKPLPGFESFCSTALCRTGVLGTTGMESAAQIRTLVRELKPDCLIVIDALAGADPSRLCRTVQVCDSGIAPGSGVGNDREPLNRDTLGIPVAAVGVPTVIDASTLGGGDAVAGMFVTPRNIDSDVRRAGRLIAYGVNLALHKDITLADIDMLVG